MSPLIRLIGAGRDEEEPELFVLFHRPVSRESAEVLNAALHELQRELAKRWAVKEVRLKYRLPGTRLPNPLTPDVAALLMRTIEGLTVIFLTRAAVAGGPVFGKSVSARMAKIVNQWQRRQFTPPKRKKKKTTKKHSK